MRSKLLNLDAYDTDKIKNGYLDVYDPILAPWVNEGITLLEFVFIGEAHSNYGVIISLAGLSLAPIASCHRTFGPESVFRSSRGTTEIRSSYPKSLVKPLRMDLTS